MLIINRNIINRLHRKPRDHSVYIAVRLTPRYDVTSLASQQYKLVSVFKAFVVTCYRNYCADLYLGFGNFTKIRNQFSEL